MKPIRILGMTPLQVLGILIFIAGFLVPYPVAKVMGEGIAALVMLIMVPVGLVIFASND